MQKNPNVFQRLGLCLLVLFRFLFDRAFAGRVLESWTPAALPEAPAREALAPPRVEAPAARPPVPPAAPAVPDAALHLLALLQREGRLVDFLQEDVSGFADADVGAAARVVHDGCRKVLTEYLGLEPVFPQPEGARITLPRGFDPAAVRLTGQVTGEPPFAGTLRHHGWRAAEIRLPTFPAGQDPRIVAPAEVEL